MQDVLKEHWGLDQTASLADRVQVAAVVCAFNNAQSRSAKAAEVEVEYEVQDRAKPMQPSEWASMRQALERRQGHLEDKLTPSKEYVEKKLSEVALGEYRAEGLTEVVSKDEVDPDALLPVWDTKGRLSVKRGATKVAEPSNAEELRRRLTIMKNALLLMSLRHTNRAELQGDYDKVFEDYKTYLLGEYVRGLVARDSEGNTISSPPWSLVLSYEHAVRKQAVRLINQEQQSWPVALKAAMRDGTVKERNFTTPLALVTKRPAPPWRQEGQNQQKFQRQQTPSQKGKGKGRGKKGNQQSGQCASHTPAGDMICYRFNAGNKRKASKCKFKHVCGLCFSDKRALPECSSKTRQDPPRDTQGGGAA